EGRGLKFCRYADDCNIYVGSKKAGERVMDSIRRFIEGKLRLKVNGKKSEVSHPWKRTFLGYSFTANTNPKIRVPKETVKRLRVKLKRLFRIGRGRNLGRFIRGYLAPILRGWISYFKLAEVKRFAQELDEWIRRRLRLIIWRQWKRRWSRFKGLMKAGLAEENAAKPAFNGRGSWWNSGTRHMNFAFRKKYFEKLGLISLLDRLKKLREQ
ncbi:MAG: group II intron maturase-specific domain-containing protein, partial [Candidatus Auribacterota bacterium]|nr:group II intron maturase-specific domain-containing protein [Candidatus Auribacterota bacterium]